MLKVVIGEQMIRFGERLGISFHRTLRIPEDRKSYPLPPGLGRFPIYKVSDYRDRLPRQWQPSAAGFIAMYQCEALWIGLNGSDWKPNAVVIAVGGINAVSGESVEAPLCVDPQNYLVAPPQPWLDGIHSEDGAIRQFMAWPLGDGRTVEAAVSGAERRGGIQITVFEPKPDRFAQRAPEKHPTPLDEDKMIRPMHMPLTPMGLGAGGRIRQKIYRDPYGIDTWDQDNFGFATLYIVNSLQFQQITGRPALPTPVNARLYTKHGLPWFEFYDEAIEGISASQRFSQIYGSNEPSALPSGVELDGDGFSIPRVQIKPIDPHHFDRNINTSSPSAGKKNSSTDE
jgi:hypothetical protein